MILGRIDYELLKFWPEIASWRTGLGDINALNQRQAHLLDISGRIDYEILKFWPEVASWRTGLRRSLMPKHSFIYYLLICMQRNAQKDKIMQKFFFLQTLSFMHFVHYIYIYITYVCKFRLSSTEYNWLILS